MNKTETLRQPILKKAFEGKTCLISTVRDFLTIHYKKNL